jgi:hypothetical protein
MNNETLQQSIARLKAETAVLESLPKAQRRSWLRGFMRRGYDVKFSRPDSQAH